jgi:hypothetical protein
VWITSERRGAGKFCAKAISSSARYENFPLLSENRRPTVTRLFEAILTNFSDVTTALFYAIMYNVLVSTVCVTKPITPPK